MRPARVLDSASLIGQVVRYRELILRLVRRRIQAQYRGSLFGALWPFVQPVFMLAVYTFVFAVVFELRWGASTGGRAHFALVLFSGLILFNVASWGLNASTRLISEHVSYVKKVVFPLEVLPIVVLVEGLFHALASYGVLILGAVAAGERLPWLGVLLAPLTALPLILLLLGAMYLLTAFSVYLRDLTQIVPVLTTVMLFLSPIFYPLEMVPERFRAVLISNPLTYFVMTFRAVLFDLRPPGALVWGAVLVLSLGFAWLGHAFFRRAKRGFADVV